jgi:hypothetical protein
VSATGIQNDREVQEIQRRTPQGYDELVPRLRRYFEFPAFMKMSHSQPAKRLQTIRGILAFLNEFGDSHVGKWAHSDHVAKYERRLQQRL